VIGAAEVISTVSRRAIASYHRSMYTGATSSPQPATSRTIGSSRCSRPERRSAAPGAGARPPPARATPPPGLRFQRKDTEQYHVRLGAPGIARSAAAASPPLLDSILGGSASSRLFQEIREKRGMAYAVYSFASQYTDTGMIGVYVGTREENLDACVEICSEQIAEIAAGKLRDGELERAQESLMGRIMLSMESTSNRMSRLGKSLISDTELLTLDRIAAEIDAVDRDALAELAAVLLAPERLSAAGVGPDEDRFNAAVRRANPNLVARAAA
jgi:predicted Zn-dependent peptidase